MVRWDSPLVIVSAGTFAVHLILVVIIDAIRVTHPYLPEPPAPRIELFEVEVPAKVTPLPPAPAPEPLAVPDEVPPTTPPPPTPRTRAPVRTSTTPPPTSAEPPPTAAVDPNAGGSGPVLAMADLGPAARGVAVARGPRTTGRIGRGGKGLGSGSGDGDGAGAGSAVQAPVSIATIKTAALPKGDQSYFNAARDYPAEARSRGIEGTIKVRIIVSAAGAVTSVKLLTKLGHGLDELALARAKLIQFEPARDTDDKPVASVVIWTFDMTLPK